MLEHTNEKLIWNNSHDGKYTVHSAYDLLKESIVDNTDVKKARQIDDDMEVETILDVIERPTHIGHHGGMVQELLVLVSELVEGRGSAIDG